VSNWVLHQNDTAFVLFREAGLGFGITISKIWIGKAALMMVMIPIVAEAAIGFSLAPTVGGWALLLAAVVTSTGFSSSGFFLMPVLIGALTPGAIWASWRRSSTAD